MDPAMSTQDDNHASIVEGFREVLRTLQSFVQSRMSAVYGSEWRSRAKEILKEASEVTSGV